MAGITKEVRTLMYSVVKGVVVVHRLPFNAKEPIGRLKLQKFLERGFTFNDPRTKVVTGKPQVIVTQEVDLGKPLDGGGDNPEFERAEVETMKSQLETQHLPDSTPMPGLFEVPKKWRDMNAQERKAYQLAKKGVTQ